jgi:hypothetical protein
MQRYKHRPAYSVRKRWVVCGLVLLLTGLVRAQAPRAPTNLRLSTEATPPPPGEGDFVLRDASNTGLAGAGISESSLTNQGSITYSSSSDGLTIRGKRFTGPVTVTGSNITFDGCLFTMAGSSSTIMLRNTGSNNTVTNSTFRPQSGSVFIGIIVEGGSLTAQTVDLSGGENNISLYGGSFRLTQSFVHDPSNANNPSGHVDGIEVYGGSNHVFEFSTISNGPGNDSVAPINVAPWSGSTSVSNLTVQDNYIDGGIEHALVDLQSSGSVRLVRFVRNRMGGHTVIYGSYNAFLNSDGRSFVQTEAALQSSPNSILWPTSGADVNIWFYCRNNPIGYPNLTPDRTGSVVTPTP